MTPPGSGTGAGRASLRDAGDQHSQAAQTPFAPESEISSSATPISILESFARMFESPNHKSSQIRMTSSGFAARQSALPAHHPDLLPKSAAPLSLRPWVESGI